MTLLPLLLLLAVIGSAGVVLLSRLGNSVNSILRENYDSVIAMERLNEALERIDSSFQFSMSGQREKARRQYDENWRAYLESLDIERNNITLDGEAELVERLTESDRHVPAAKEMPSTTWPLPTRPESRVTLDRPACWRRSTKSRTSPARFARSTKPTWSRPAGKRDSSLRQSLVWFGSRAGGRNRLSQ